MDRQWRVVVASSDPETRQRVEGMLRKHRLDPICVSSLGQCLGVLEQYNVGLVFCDRYLADGGYQNLLGAATHRTKRENARIVLMSDIVEPEEYHFAKRSGLFEVIASPCRPTDVEWMVIRAKREEFVRSTRLMTAPFGLARSVAN